VVEFGDVVPDDGAVDVVGSALEHDLGHGQGLHDPEGFDVGEVVEHQAGDGEGAVVFEAAGAWEVFEIAAVGEEGEGDDGLVVAGGIGDWGLGIGGRVGAECEVFGEDCAGFGERDDGGFGEFFAVAKVAAFGGGEVVGVGG